MELVQRHHHAAPPLLPWAVALCSRSSRQAPRITALRVTGPPAPFGARRVPVCRSIRTPPAFRSASSMERRSTPSGPAGSPGVDHANRGRRLGTARSRRPNVVAVSEALGAVVSVHNGDRAGPDEDLQRSVDGVGRPLVQPPSEGRTGWHPYAGSLAVAQQHRVQPNRGVADLGIQQPLRHDREAVLDDRVWGLRSVVHIGESTSRYRIEPGDGGCFGLRQRGPGRRS